MFLPTTAKELEILGWERPDIILITGTGYVLMGSKLTAYNN